MGECLVKIPHSCGTKTGLQVFADENGGVNGYCFKCKNYVPHPYGDEDVKAESLPKPKKKSAEEIAEEISEIETYQTINVESKRLRKSSLEYYGVKVAVSEQDGKTPTTLCYPYFRDGEKVGYKLKILEKKIIWSVGDLKGCDFFGWEQAVKSGAKRLIITEGEDDAVSLHRVIDMYTRNEDFKDYTAVVSLPRGVHSALPDISKNIKKLESNFKEIVLCFDMDDPGRSAVDEVCKAFPSIRSMDIPGKDANQCVMDGKSKALYNCTFKINKPKNSRLVNATSLFEAAKEPPKYGELTWPWNHINKATRGVRYGEVIYLGAGTKMGKSEVVNALGAHFIYHHSIPILMAKPEEDNRHTVKLVAGKMVGRIFHDPEREFDEGAYDKATEMIGDRLNMLDLYQHLGWETLKEDIRFAVVELGVRAIFIDPITNLVAGMPSSEANTKLEEISVELAAMAKDLQFVAFVFCHLKSHDGNISKEKREKYYRDGKFIGLGNCEHEYGGDIYSSQFAGSRAMKRSCHLMVGLEGNKDPELDEDTQNLRNIKILESRTFASTGIFPLYWDSNTSLFKEL